MSTFSGKIQEIPNISVDRFDGNNWNSEAYFLSHCHSDHMKGLNSGYFQNMLIKNGKFLYASDVSCVILKRMFPIIENNVIGLDIYEPTLITLKTQNLSVSTVSAGHCPGSIMFLFEIGSKCILYTGDYRINKNDIKKFKCFYNSFNEVKLIDKIYLDTTFFLKRYLKFPKREESLNELCKIIKEWTGRGKDYLVHLCTSATYGYEYVFIEINKKIGIPVHVNYKVFKVYSVIPEMDKSVTVDSSITQIHSNCGYTYQSICNQSHNSRIKIVKVSAFRWQQTDLENGLSADFDDICYICYSTHASFEEGLELLKFLKPKSVEACVTHKDPYINFEMTNLIAETLEEFMDSQHSEEKPKLFDTRTVSLKEVPSKRSRSKDTFGILDSPPSVQKKIIIKGELENFGESGTTINTDYKQGKESRKSSFRLESKEWSFEEEFGILAPPSYGEQKKTFNRDLGEFSATKSIERIRDNTIEVSCRLENKFWSFEEEFGIHDSSGITESKRETSNSSADILSECFMKETEKDSVNLNNTSSFESSVFNELLSVDNRESTLEDKDLVDSVIFKIIDS